MFTRLNINIRILKLFIKLNNNPAINSTLSFPKKGLIKVLKTNKKNTDNEDSKEDKILNPNKLFCGNLILRNNFIFEIFIKN